MVPDGNLVGENCLGGIICASGSRGTHPNPGGGPPPGRPTPPLFAPRSPASLPLHAHFNR